MPNERSAPAGLWCPVCLTRVGDQVRCPRCGLPQVGPDPARLRVIVAHRQELSEHQAALTTELAALDEERGRLLASVRGAPWPGPPGPAPTPAGPVPAPTFADWRPERVRDVLLWLGAALLALSAITFTIVAWARLDAAGRAGLLLGVTALTGGVAIALRQRLRATAEALSGLTLALALVDWYALRRSGVGSGVPVETWWAFGTALVAGIGFAGARGLDLRSARLAAALLALTSGAFTVAATADAAWTGAVGIALVATIGVAAAHLTDRRTSWHDAAAVLAGGSALFELTALGLAIIAIADIETSADAVGPALAVLSLALAPGVAVTLAGERGRGRVLTDVLFGLTTAAVIGAPVTLMAADLDEPALAAIAAGLGVVAIAAGRLAPRALRFGVAGAGAGAIALGLVGLLPRAGLAMVVPLTWLSDPWSGSLGAPAIDQLGPTHPLVLHAGWATAGVLVAAAIGAALAGSRPAWRAPLTSAVPTAAVAGITLPVALAVALVASGASIGAVLAVEVVAALALTGLAVALQTRRSAVGPWLLCAAGLLAVPALGWAAADRTATLVSLGAVIAGAGIAGAVSRAPAARVALCTVAAAAALTEAGAVVVTATERAGPAGFAIAVTGGALLVLGVLGRKSAPEGPAFEAVGIFGLALGASISTASPTWLAATLTAAVPALGVSALRRDRAAAYAWSTAATAVAATWAWLAVVNVAVLEAYTLPAAAVLLGAGVIRRRANPEVRSWGAYGPGLLLALGPSLLVAVERGGTARPLGVIAGALVCVLVGSRRRLQAPLLVGALALLALAVDDLGPVAAQLPRWVLLGIAGLLVLWLGVSAERRLHQLRGWRSSFDRLA